MLMNVSRLLAVSLYFSVVSPTLAAQLVRAVVKEGDPALFSSATFVRFHDIAPLDTGPDPELPYFAMNAVLSSSPQSALVINLDPIIEPGFLLQGDPNSAMAGLPELNATPSCFQPLQSLVSLMGPAESPVLCYGTQILLRPGEFTTIPGMTDWLYQNLNRSVANANQDCLVHVKLNDNGVVHEALVRIDLASSCGLQQVIAQELVVRTGMQIPSGGSTLTSIREHPKHTFDFNTRNDHIYIGEFDSNHHSIVFNGTRIASDGGPVPGGSGNLSDMEDCRVDLNDFGDYVYRSRTATPIGEVIVRNGTKFIQVGDPVPDPAIGSFTLTGLGDKSSAGVFPAEIAPAFITNGGDVIWYGSWDDPDTSQNEGIFLNHLLLAREGHTQAPDTDGSGTLRITGFGQSDTAFGRDIAVSPNGRYVYFEAMTVSSGSTPESASAIFSVDLGESVPYGT